MTYADIGATGAKAQSFHDVNTRDLLIEVIDELGHHADRKAMFRLLEDKIMRSPNPAAHRLVQSDYWFTNNLRAALYNPKGRRGRRPAREDIKERIIAGATRLVFGESLMPNGKFLNECTGRECAAMGGWLAAIAKKVKPGQKVGAVLSEAQLRALWSKK